MTNSGAQLLALFLGRSYRYWLLRSHCLSFCFLFPCPNLKKITLSARGPPLLALYRRHLVVDDWYRGRKNSYYHKRRTLISVSGVSNEVKARVQWRSCPQSTASLAGCCCLHSFFPEKPSLLEYVHLQPCTACYRKATSDSRSESRAQFIGHVF